MIAFIPPSPGSFSVSAVTVPLVGGTTADTQVSWTASLGANSYRLRIQGPSGNIYADLPAGTNLTLAVPGTVLPASTAGMVATVFASYDRGTEWASRSFTSPPLPAVLSAPAITLSVSTSGLTATATITNTGGAYTSLSINWGDGTTNGSTTHTYAGPGVYTVTATATNAAGSSSATDYAIVANLRSISGLGTRWTDLAKTVPATAGSLIADALNVGTGTDLSQSTSGYRPVLTLMGDGKYADSFVGSEQLNFTPITMVFPIYAYVVLTPRSGGTSTQAVFNRDTSGGAPYAPALYLSGNKIDAYWGSNFVFNGVGPSIALDQRCVCRWRLDSGPVLGARLNRGSEVTGTPDTSRISSWISFSDSINGQYLQADVHEILMVNGSTIGTAADTVIMDNFSTRWGTP